ncbi:hypothetical protein [Aquimarina sp. RZ0]|uniref:hypothetical protein n=1 Tax=Aquimarina sp. RZ0 TaxID=2607730 RepID=UPI0011F257CD|nr:hypothetical protein [Aquimarina sp. RZ0]KAA1241433.1 hypothetical protein F0000_26615 [Aquimarina sp. RZ0]
MSQNITSLLVFIFFTFFSVCKAQTSYLSEKVKKNIKSRVENSMNPGIVIGVIDDNGTHYYNYGVKSL